MSRRKATTIGVGLVVGVLLSHPRDGAASEPRASRVSSARDSTQLRARVDLAIAEFHAEWQRYWRQSEQFRRESADRRVLALRSTHAHCDIHIWNDPSRTNRARVLPPEALPDSQYRMRKSEASAFGVCPSWLLESSVADALDESAWRDGALLEAFRGASQQARSALLATLDSAAARLPGDGWILGQRVRFLIDQREFSKALDVTRACRAERWWCAALQGLAFARMGELRQAEIVYREMQDSMPSRLRCEWNDVRELLPIAERDAYAGTPCGERSAVEARLWWLATPLFRSGVNERLVEQESRRVDVALRVAGGDERHAIDRERGGDALVAMALRYGWPSYRGWLGAREDRSHDNYLVNNHRSPAAPPYTTFEYTLGRMAAFPRWRVVGAPFDATSSDWTISVDDEQGRPDPAWWPTEHYRPSQRLVQLKGGQVVFLRRQQHVEIAWAVRIDHPALLSARRPFDVMLLASRSPAQTDSLDQRMVLAASTAVLRSPVTNAPAIVAIEALGTGDDLLGARTRFGVSPPAPLAVMRPQALELSTPVLLDLSVDVPSNVLDHPTDALLERMAGSVSFSPDQRRVGVYWESYGIAGSDTADVSISISAVNELGAVRRAAMAAGMVSDPRSRLAVAWTDADALRSTTTLAGPVPVQIRAMALDLSRLTPGLYSIEVQVALPDGRKATSQRRITLTP